MIMPETIPLNPAERTLAKAQFLSEYNDNHCQFMHACDTVGVTSTTIANWLIKDKAFDKAKKRCDELLNERVATRMVRVALGLESGNIVGAIFYLKCKAGWVDRQEISHKHEGFDAPPADLVRRRVDETSAAPSWLKDGGVPPDVPDVANGTRNSPLSLPEGLKECGGGVGDAAIVD